MKKTYIAPAATALRRHRTHLIRSDGRRDGGARTSRSSPDHHTEGLGWNTDDWSGEGEE